jgi:tRNA (guanosine-2'-O-)-methyltransferase
MISKTSSMTTPERKEKIEAVVVRRQNLVIVLEDISDPHNAAAVLRTCDAFGVQEVHFVFDQQASWNPARVGRVSSSSANKWLTFHRWKHISACYEQLRARDLWIGATTCTPDATDFYKQDYTRSGIALVFGNEHRGVSEAAALGADARLYLPMRGMVQSLNLSVTAALCIAEVSRQREQVGWSRYALSPEQQLMLRRDWGVGLNQGVRDAQDQSIV